MIHYAINKILVPLDFSETSLNALHTAIEMAHRHNAKVILLNVIEAGCEERKKISENELRAKRIIQLNELVNTISSQEGITCTHACSTGNVSHQIENMANKLGADIIVVGTHGQSGYNPEAIGTNAQTLINQAGCPVLTVPPLKKWMAFKEILFPIRPTAGVDKKYDYLKNIILKNQSILKILSLSNNYEGNITLIKNLAKELNQAVAQDNVKASNYFKIGKNLAGEVVKISSLLKTDLIVISSAIDNTFQNLFNASYVRQILNQARVPILCLRS